MKSKIFKNHKIIFSVILFLVPVSQASIDIYSPSLPKIVENLNTNNSSVQLTMSLFLLALGIGQYFYGALSDNIGRKNSLLIGMVIFTMSSFMCYFASNIIILIIARFFQGLGAASIAVLSKTVSVDLYQGIDLMKASAYVGLIWGVAPIIAPVIGGYLDSYGGWRMSFLVLSLYGIISCIFIVIFMKETNTKYTKFNIKYTFYKSIEIAKNADFMGSTIIIATTNMGLFVFNIMSPFLIQNILGKSQIYYGYMALIIGVIYILGAFMSKFAIKNFDGENIIRFMSTILLFVGIFMIIFAFIYPKSITILMITSSIFAFASGFLYPFLVIRMFAPFQNLAGIVSANYGLLSYVFSGTITIFLSYLSITSLKQIAYAYGLVAFITYLAMKRMLRYPKSL